jgi:hypothetical protein
MEARLSDCFVTADGVALDENQRKSVASHFKDALKELIAKRTIVNPQLGMISKQRVVLDIHHLKIVSAT